MGGASDVHAAFLLEEPVGAVRARASVGSELQASCLQLVVSTAPRGSHLPSLGLRFLICQRGAVALPLTSGLSGVGHLSRGMLTAWMKGPSVLTVGLQLLSGTRRATCACSAGCAGFQRQVELLQLGVFLSGCRAERGQAGPPEEPGVLTGSAGLLHSEESLQLLKAVRQVQLRYSVE